MKHNWQESEKVNSEWSETAYADLPRELQGNISWADFHSAIQSEVYAQEEIEREGKI